MPRSSRFAGLTVLALLAFAADPRAGALRTLPPMDAARASHSASALPDGTVLVAGGMSGEGEPVAGVVVPLPSGPLSEVKKTSVVSASRCSSSARMSRPKAWSICVTLAWCSRCTSSVTLGYKALNWGSDLIG